MSYIFLICAYCINLSDNLKTEFKEDRVIFADGELLFEFNRKKVDSFIFSETVGIETAHADASAPVMGPGSMSFSNLPGNSRIQVVAINGSVVADVTVSGNYALNLNGWTAGVYVVKVNGLSYKVIVK